MRYKSGLAALLFVACMLWMPVPGAKSAVTVVQAGEPAPDFTLLDQNGKPVRLADFKGKQAVVLAWFVKASTAG